MNRQDDPAALKRGFDEQGYVVLRGFFQGAELDELLARADAFVRDTVPSMPSELRFYEDKARPETLKQVRDLPDYDDYFSAMVHGGSLQRVAEAVLGEDVAYKNLQWFNKPPSVGQPTPPHQDGYYFKIDPPDAVTMWLALDSVDQTNGCLFYVPGSHKRGVLEHDWTDTLGFSQSLAGFGDADRAQAVRVEAEPGDLLVHHALTIHMANGNTSAGRHRRSLGAVYYPARAVDDKPALEAHRRAMLERMQTKI